MIFVSINPFALKRFFFFLLAVIGLSCVSCFGESSLFLKVKTTPYDIQMSRIRPILLSDGNSAPGDVSLGMVNHWINDLRSIPYGFTKEWKTPAETQSGAAADCKAKAVALYQTMVEHGASNLRLVIGKRTSTSRSTHAWLEWDSDTGGYVLDPTINWRAYRTSDLGPRSYIPLYAFAGSRKFRVCAGAADGPELIALRHCLSDCYPAVSMRSRRAGLNCWKRRSLPPNGFHFLTSASQLRCGAQIGKALGRGRVLQSVFRVGDCFGRSRNFHCQARPDFLLFIFVNMEII